MSAKNENKVYITATDARRRIRSRHCKVEGMTPFQFITLIKRITKGDLLVVDAKTREPIAA